VRRRRRQHCHRHHRVTAQHRCSKCNLQQLHELLPRAVPAPLRPHFLQSHSICSAVSRCRAINSLATRHGAPPPPPPQHPQQPAPLASMTSAIARARAAQFPL
jgi:hypothetical protein